MADPEDILAFWLDEVGPAGWYRADDKLDQDIRDRFLDTWLQARAGACSLWLTYSSGTLAYIILTDQLSRNMFRNSHKCFATDRSARAAAKSAISKGWDLRIDEPARQFFYMPLMHSENLCDQDRSVRLILTRMPQAGETTFLHAKAHRQVIRQFGRFPYRNQALSRDSTAPEIAYIKNGGYKTTIEALKAKQAA